MFAHLFTAAVLAISAAASPLAAKPASTLAARGSHSFNNWGGFESLNNFDNFYGADSFCHVKFEQTIVHERQVVCHTQAIEVIQQRLVVLQEMAKKIITEQICEVETQTIVFSQFHGSLGGFYDDLRRHSGQQVGYDEGIVGHYGDLVGSDGSISTNDLGFTGSDVGKSTVVATGNNWDDNSSPKSVDSAYFAAQGAQFGL